MGFRHWASTPPVSRRSRQSATGPPGSYPDRTHTGKRRRADDTRSTTYTVNLLSAGRTERAHHCLLHVGLHRVHIVTLHRLRRAVQLDIVTWASGPSSRSDTVTLRAVRSSDVARAMDTRKDRLPMLTNISSRYEPSHSSTGSNREGARR